MQYFTTFEAELSEEDSDYLEYKHGRVIINTETTKPIFQVYNEINIKEVNGFNIKLLPPFDKEFRYGRIVYNRTCGRVAILLMYKDNFSRKTSWLSRYVYQIHKGLISDDLHVDHNNGNRLDDRINNLTEITELHNYQKSLYGRHWLPKYNSTHNTNYQEKDLLDIVLLRRVIAYVDTIRSDELKQLKSKYRKVYNVENKQHISDYNKQYGKIFYQENKDFVNKRKWLSSKINNLVSKDWTIELGKEIIFNIEKMFSLYNLTLSEVVKGLDVTKYQPKTINRLFHLALLYSQNYNKINENQTL